MKESLHLDWPLFKTMMNALMWPNRLIILMISRVILVSLLRSSSAQSPGVSITTTGRLGSPLQLPSLKSTVTWIINLCWDRIEQSQQNVSDCAIVDDAHLYVGVKVQASGSSLTSKYVLSSPGELRIRLSRVLFPSPASPIAAITSFWSGSEGSFTMISATFWLLKQFNLL